MITPFPPAKLKALRHRAMLSMSQVTELTGISQPTLTYLEHGTRRPQTRTLTKLLNLYEIQITKLERLDKIWGADGTSGANGVVKISRPYRSAYPSQSPVNPAGRRIQSNPERCAQS